MFRRRAHFGRLLLACLLLNCTCPLVTTAQNNPAGQINLTYIEKSIEQGRVEEIEKPLLDYAVAHPTDVRALELLGQVRYKQGRFAEAKALYQRVLALDPSLVKAEINLGHILYELGQREEARLLLARVAQKTPSADPRVQLALARALLKVGEFEKALAATDKLPLGVKSGEALPVRAASHLALGDRQSLSALIPSMRKAAVSRPVVAAECAEVLHSAGMTQQAIGLLRSALATAPNNTGVLVLLGRLEIEMRDFAQARQHLDRAARLDARSADVLSSLAMLESAQGNFAAALVALEQARSLAPDSTSVLAQFVVTAMRANRAHAALDGASALIRLQPDEPEFLYLFGAASLQSGSLGAAQNALERYVEQRPRDPRGCLALGIALAGQRDQSEAARAQFKRCLQIDPSNVEAKYQLSLVFKSQGEVREAIQLLEEVTERAPQHADALRDLGTLYLQTGDDRRARAVLERAVALAPQDAETHFQLSRLYNRISETALAERHMALFQKLKSQREKGAIP